VLRHSRHYISVHTAPHPRSLEYSPKHVSVDLIVGRGFFLFLVIDFILAAENKSLTFSFNVFIEINVNVSHTRDCSFQLSATSIGSLRTADCGKSVRTEIKQAKPAKYSACA